MSYQGYIKLYRKIKEKKWWRKQREKFTWALAWIDLLLRASHKTVEIPFNGGIYKIPKGSFLTSQRKLSKEWNWSISTVNSYLEWLKKKEKSIDFKTSPAFTHIFILNWTKYQEEAEKLKINSKETRQKLDDAEPNADPNTLFKGKTKRPERLPEHQIEHQPNTSRTPAETINNVKECKRNIASNKRRKDIAFQGKDYNLVLEEYQRLKNIRLQGEEFKPIKQGIKTMFMSDRTSEQIIACMEWLAGNEFYKDKWTINTVAKKLPEFVAGKLNKSKDLYVD